MKLMAVNNLCENEIHKRANTSACSNINHLEKDNNCKSLSTNDEILKNTNNEILKNTLTEKHISFWETINFIHLPQWLQDNHFLLNGHRPPMPSFTACFKSIFAIHTETGNIWTHLIGTILLSIVMISFCLSHSDVFQWKDRLIFSIFFTGTILCLLFSTFFHTVACHSEKICKFGSKLDYTGISIKIMSAFAPWLYYSFYCQPKIIAFYSFLVLVFGTASIVVSMWDKFAGAEYRGIRAATFISLGLVGIFPVGHFIIINGLDVLKENTGLDLLVYAGIFYIGGAIIYAFRFPERYWSGKFDIWLQSHQIFHVCVVFGAFANFYGSVSIGQFRMSLGQCSL